MTQYTAETDPDAEHFGWMSSGLYRRILPDTVWRALQYAVRYQLHAENPTIVISFIRAAEVYDEVKVYLEGVREDANDSEKAALKLVLDPPEGIRKGTFVPEEIQSPGEMDLCWIEFLVTGETDAIEKVVAVLDRDDLTRAMVGKRLSDQSDTEFELTDEERTNLSQMGINLGLASDEGPDVIMSPGDVDVLIWFGVKAGHEASIKIMKAMDDELKLHVACKGAALWSLQSNATQHGKIRLLCEQHAQQPGGFGRKMLLPE